MSWRNQGITGSNNIPLGKARRFGSEAGDEDRSAISSPGTATNFDRDVRSRSRDRDVKRGRSPESMYHIPSTAFAEHMLTLFSGADDGPKRRKKRNRWGDATENKAAGLMGLPTAIVANMTSEQLEAYTLHLRIEEITQKLKIDDVVPADGDRFVPPYRPCLDGRNPLILSLDPLRQLRSTTTTVVVSTPENTVTASASKMSATSSSRRR